MAIFSSKQNNGSEEIESAEGDKKIEFSQKLPTGDLEGKEASKAGDFDFLKNFKPRNPGESTPVKMATEMKTLLDGETGEEEISAEPQDKKDNSFDFFSEIKKIKEKFFKKVDSSRVLELDLAKGEVMKFFDWQRGVLIILVAVFGTVAVLSGIYWGISYWGTSSHAGENDDYLQQYYRASKQINDLTPQVNDILVFKNRLDGVDFLLKRHIYWTNFFSFLEDNTLSNVYFYDFSGTVKGSYSLSATTDSLDAIDAQTKKLLTNQYVKSATVDSGAISNNKGKSTVSFSLSFVLDPKIFLK
jgi:hypothetical protein